MVIPESDFSAECCSCGVRKIFRPGARRRREGTLRGGGGRGRAGAGKEHVGKLSLDAAWRKGGRGGK